jgi:hypothetical protein
MTYPFRHHSHTPTPRGTFIAPGFRHAVLSYPAHYPSGPLHAQIHLTCRSRTVAIGIQPVLRVRSLDRHPADRQNHHRAQTGQKAEKITKFKDVPVRRVSRREFIRR